MASLFGGPTQAEIWSQLAEQLKGEFDKGGWFRKKMVRARSGNWEIVLDNYVVSTGNSIQVFTRLRAPFLNKSGIRFKIYREGFFQRLGKKFGMQDLEIGLKAFDEAFVIQGTSRNYIRKILDDKRIVELIEAQPKINFQIRDKEPNVFRNPYPDGVDLLYFERHGVVKDLEQLRNLFVLFALVLERMVEAGLAYPGDPNVEIK